MGSVYASLLGKAGHEVWAIDVWQEHIDAIAASGLTVSGASGSFVVDNLHVGRSPQDAGACDVWLIATKASEVEQVAVEIAPLLQPDNRGHGLPERARCGGAGGAPHSATSTS